jgi:hypothetical protein
MKLRRAAFLGLIVSERSITCAQAPASADSAEAAQAVVLNFPPEVSIDQPEAAGKMLRDFLKSHHLSAARAVVGIPARWLIAAENDLPPADEAGARAILRLAAERLSVIETGELVFDFAGRADPAKPAKVLLVGLPRHRLEQIRTLVESADLTLAAVTSIGLTLSLRAGSLGQPMLLLGRHGAEIASPPRLLRHIALPAMNGHGLSSVAPLGAELRRTVGLMSANGESRADELLLWNDLGIPAEQVNELSQRLGVRIRSVESSAGPDGALPAAAAALAAAAAQRQPLPLNFADSRLKPQRRQRLGRRTVWAAALGIVAALAILMLYLDLRGREQQLQQLNTQLSSIGGDLATAQAMIDRVKYSRGYFDDRPAPLDALRQVTLAFRDDEPIWTTSFSVRDNGKGQLIGLSTDQRSVLALMDRLKNSSGFADVKLLDMRESTTGGAAATRPQPEISFSISFTFLGTN